MIISSRTAGEGKGGGWGRGEERILEIQMEEILVMNITEQLRERVKEERICDLGHTRHSGLVPPDVLGLVLCLFEPIPLQITHRIIGISAGLLYQLVLPPREFRTRVSVHSATLPTEKKIGHERLGGGRAGGGGVVVVGVVVVVVFILTKTTSRTAKSYSPRQRHGQHEKTSPRQRHGQHQQPSPIGNGMGNLTSIPSYFVFVEQSCQYQCCALLGYPIYLQSIGVLCLYVCLCTSSVDPPQSKR